MKKTAVIISLASFLIGCASPSKEIAATYISPIQYQRYDCDQLIAESERVRSAAIASGAQIDKAASNDAGITAVGAVLFWPALFFLGGNQAKEAEYGRLKGETDAIEKAMIEKRCHLQPASDKEEIQTDVREIEHITITSSKQPASK